MSLGELDADSTAAPIHMRDGVRLWGDLYLPAGVQAARGSSPRVPSVLIRLPYGTTRGYTYMPEVAKYLSARGFAVLVQDVRGRFRSEGDRTPWFHEREDGYDTIDWMSSQDWSNGSVGMIGNSYYGFTQWAAASSGHPALKAIVPRYTSQSIPPAPWFTRDGAVSTPTGTVRWLAWMWSGAGDPGDDIDVDLDARPLTASIGPSHENARRILAMRLGMDDDEFERAVFGERGRPAPRLEVAALHVAGWWDNCKPYQLGDWAEAITSPAGRHQFLHIDATDHRDVRFSVAGQADPDWLHGDDTALAEYLPRMLEVPVRFFDHYLRGAEGPADLPRVQFRVTNGDWVEAASWPLPGTEELVLNLGSGHRALADEVGGTLTAGPVAAETVAWEHDPSRPVPSLAVDDFTILLDLPDERAVHARDDVATFTSSPEAVAVEIVGSITADLEIATDAPSTSVIATLCDVAPDGRSWMIAEGVTTATGATSAMAVSIDLGAIAYRLQAGHRLRLAVSSSRHPRYVCDPGTGESPWFATTTRTVHQQLYVGGSFSSSIRVPILRPTSEEPS